MAHGGCHGTLWGRNPGEGVRPHLQTGSLTHPVWVVALTTGDLYFLPISFLGNSSVSGTKALFDLQKPSVILKLFRFMQV